MLTGEIRNQVDQIWNAFWSGGVSNPLSVIEQITYLLFIKRLDDLHTLEENKASALGNPMERRIFPRARTQQGAVPTTTCAGRGSRTSSRAEMMKVVDEHVFPFLRTLGEEGSSYGHAHEGCAPRRSATPALLAKVVEMLDNIPMEDRDTKGDVYEYMLGKIASAGQNGQFRTPRHIIQLMVEMTAPTPEGRDLRSRRRHLRLPRRGRRVSARQPPGAVPRRASSASTSTTACSTASTSTRRCCASAR